MVKILGLSIAIGAMLGAKNNSVFDTAEQKAKQPGDSVKETDRKLEAARGFIKYPGVIKYREKLEKLRNNQKEPSFFAFCSALSNALRYLAPDFALCRYLNRVCVPCLTP